MKTLLLCAVLVLAMAGCKDQVVKPDPPVINVVVPVVCNEQTVKGVTLAPVEFTLVDGVDVLTHQQSRWVALTLDGWAALMSNQNLILEHQQSLEAVVAYYQSCVKAAQAVKPAVTQGEAK